MKSTFLSPSSDEDLLPIRYLNDIVFCERRAALHVNEQLWVHNQYTVEGIHSHQRVDRARESSRSGCLTAYSVWLVSRRLGLVGVSDVIEFHQPEGDAVVGAQGPRNVAEFSESFDSSGVEPSHISEAIRGRIPYPVEFKRGRRKRWDSDDVQLCAQALCLEEMLGVAVPRGAIFHVKSRQRREVAFDGPLRETTERTVSRLRDLVTRGETPPAKYEKKCDRCSLKELCLPKAMRPRATASRYLSQLIASPEPPLDAPNDRTHEP